MLGRPRRGDHAGETTFGRVRFETASGRPRMGDPCVGDRAWQTTLGRSCIGDRRPPKAACGRPKPGDHAQESTVERPRQRRKQVEGDRVQEIIWIGRQRKTTGRHQEASGGHRRPQGAMEFIWVQHADTNTQRHLTAPSKRPRLLFSQ